MVRKSVGLGRRPGSGVCEDKQREGQRDREGAVLVPVLVLQLDLDADGGAAEQTEQSRTEQQNRASDRDHVGSGHIRAGQGSTTATNGDGLARERHAMGKAYGSRGTAGRSGIVCRPTARDTQ